MKKYLTSLATICTFIFIFMSTASANLYDDLKNDPKYIYIGGAGTGISTFMDKTSINVHKYAPPIYIIAFKAIDYSSGFAAQGVPESVKPRNYRYYYDYSTRRMYEEYYNIENQAYYWRYIDAQSEFYNQHSAANLILTGGEIAFYLAYNMSFYDEPKTYLTKEYISNH